MTTDNNRLTDLVASLRRGEADGVDGWWSTMAEAADALEAASARIAALEAALKPFAEVKARFEDIDDDEYADCLVTMGDLRAARAAMEGKDV